MGARAPAEHDENGWTLRGRWRRRARAAWRPVWTSRSGVGGRPGDLERTPLAPDTLVHRERGEGIRERLAGGGPQGEIELQQGDEDESTREDLLVRQAQPIGRVYEVAEQQDVDVDGPRAVPRPPRLAAEIALDGLAGVQQLLGAERGLDAQARVQEARLVEDLADRVGVVGRRAREHLDAAGRQRVDRGLEVRAPVADVRAQAEVRDHSVSASWRECARRVPSAAHSRPSSSKKPSRASLERKAPSTGAAGRGRAARMWTVKSIVGAAKGRPLVTTNGAGTQASASATTSAASSSRSSRGAIQPPVTALPCSPSAGAMRQLRMNGIGASSLGCGIGSGGDTGGIGPSV